MKIVKISSCLILSFIALSACQTKNHEIIIKKEVQAPKKFGDTPRPVIVNNAGDNDFKITKNDANQSWVARHIYTDPQYRENIDIEQGKTRIQILNERYKTSPAN